MCRLLQGEVGSGKTVVATAALLLAAANGFQGAFMAPTEILAEQHFATICQLLSRLGREEGEGNIKSYTGFLDSPLKVALLIGDIKQAGKKKIQKQIQDGEIDIVIGTHALMQKGVEFSKLGLAVVDEQHRFGVEQRSALREKGFNPHMLVMTATPIPAHPGADALRRPRPFGDQRAAAGEADGQDEVAPAGPAGKRLRLCAEAGGRGAPGFHYLPPD